MNLFRYLPLDDLVFWAIVIVLIAAFVGIGTMFLPCSFWSS